MRVCLIGPPAVRGPIGHLTQVLLGGRDPELVPTRRVQSPAEGHCDWPSTGQSGCPSLPGAQGGTIWTMAHHPLKAHPTCSQVILPK